MKNLKDILKMYTEGYHSPLGKFLVYIKDLKPNQVIYVGRLDIDENDPRYDVDAHPCKVKVIKRGTGIRFANYDDERDIFTIDHCINAPSHLENKRGRCPINRIAVFDNEDIAEKMCKYYNKHTSVDTAFRDSYDNEVIGDDYFSVDI